MLSSSRGGEPLARRARASLGLLALTLASASASCGPEPSSSGVQAAPGAELDFTGSWNGAGTRQTITLGAERRASILKLRGTMLLAGANRPGAGFHSDVVALVDSATGLQGRSVWTDERGDQVFSELQGQGTAARHQLQGTFLGGTGRYSGVTGSYEFTWQFVMESEDGSIQGRAVDLKGHVRLDPAAQGRPR